VPRLAPLYDLLPVRLDAAVTHDLSFKIGSAGHPDAISLDDMNAFFSNFGLSPSATQNFLFHAILPMFSKLDEVAKTLVADGLKDFDDLIGREIYRLSGTFSFELNIRERDVYLNAAGGWGLNS
jgi:serine/threonine-protein kinase HipA